jgi:Holliday junction DNA helicase RuvA
MIRTLTGEITYLTSDGIVIDVAGVGYQVLVPNRSIPSVGDQKMYFIYHHVREDNVSLYGFETQDELDIFMSLITVNSIGPKLALVILNSATPAEIRQAVDGNNIGYFQSLPGVGKKSAAKIIVELKGKLSNTEIVIPAAGEELMLALKSLGYEQSEIMQVIKKLPSEITDSDLQVAWALKELGR